MANHKVQVPGSDLRSQVSVNVVPRHPLTVVQILGSDGRLLLSGVGRQSLTVQEGLYHFRFFIGERFSDLRRYVASSNAQGETVLVNGPSLDVPSGLPIAGSTGRMVQVAEGHSEAIRRRMTVGAQGTAAGDIALSAFFEGIAEDLPGELLVRSAVSGARLFQVDIVDKRKHYGVCLSVPPGPYVVQFVPKRSTRLEDLSYCWSTVVSKDRRLHVFLRQSIDGALEYTAAEGEIKAFTDEEDELIYSEALRNVLSVRNLRLRVVDAGADWSNNALVLVMRDRIFATVSTKDQALLAYRREPNHPDLIAAAWPALTEYERAACRILAPPMLAFSWRELLRASIEQTDDLVPIGCAAWRAAHTVEESGGWLNWRGNPFATQLGTAGKRLAERPQLYSILDKIVSRLPEEFVASLIWESEPSRRSAVREHGARVGLTSSERWLLDFALYRVQAEHKMKPGELERWHLWPEQALWRRLILDTGLPRNALLADLVSLRAKLSRKVSASI